MSRRLVVLLTFASASVLTVACGTLGSDPGGGLPVSLVFMDSRVKGSGYTTYPMVNFYRAQTANFTDALQTTDTCQQAAFSSAVNPNQTSAPVIGGGAYVAVLLSSHADTLLRATTADGTYHVADPAGFVYNPGDSITITVPGDAAGFPPITATSRTAEPFTLNPIVIPPASQSMSVTWSTALDNNAGMIISLRYNDGTAGAGLNQQIFCDFHDDGAGIVPAALAATWAASSQREVFAERIRTLLVTAPSSSSAFLNILSVFEVPTPTSP
jgi:hypothetical protein